jgi:hypothetical protein
MLIHGRRDAAPEVARRPASHSNTLIYVEIVVPGADPVNELPEDRLAAYTPQATHSILEYGKIRK